MKFLALNIDFSSFKSQSPRFKKACTLGCQRGVFLKSGYFTTCVYKHVHGYVSVYLQLLIGYNRGLIVLWDCKKNKADQVYNAAQVAQVFLLHFFNLLFYLYHLYVFSVIFIRNSWHSFSAY